jgi:S-adenosylmethionine-diacylglycerol 3-amino-3-carboxypropyl transferase
MRDNPLQFAVVREDPIVEETLAMESPTPRVLLVASGGCTALALAARQPHLELTLFDLNPHQLAHCERKRTALALPDALERARLLNVDDDAPSGLNACGNFESLFRGLRTFLADLAASPAQLAAACDGDRDAIAALLASRYWPVAFDLFFADPLLLAMFGPDAVQHAPPGSYPRYFQSVLERGLARTDARDNYFLHHVLLGRYVEREEAWPAYLRAAPCALPRWTEVHGTLEAVPELSRYGLISLSNLFDWMSHEGIERTCRHLAARVAPGTLVVVRQLNNALDLTPFLAPRFDLDHTLAEALHAKDRSLFYARLWIGRAR